MTLSAVATRYANALADVVAAPGSPLTPEAAAAQLRAMESAVRQSRELALALETPSIPASRKKAVIARMGQTLQFSPITRNFLFILVDRRRTGSLSEIIQAFEAAIDERTGVARAEVASAGELSESERAALASQLEKLTGKRIRMAFSVDQSLIGGAVARVGSTIYDGSVRGSLESLKRRLTAESLAG
jgi:F-type H+-transporting ATPase subunit delta